MSAKTILPGLIMFLVGLLPGGSQNKKAMQIKCMPVNPIEMNLYVVYEKDGEGVIIDPGCFSDSEFQRVFDFVEQENITLKHILLTHPHFDHVMGAARLCKQYGLPLELHEQAVAMLDGAVKSVASFGLPPIEKPTDIKAFKDRDRIEFAGTYMEVRHTPGHCQGSVSFVLPAMKTVFTGDALFNGSIGRTDFPTGDYDLLKKSIYEQLFTLDEDYTVRSGHGGRTTIEQEKYNNPFL